MPFPNPDTQFKPGNKFGGHKPKGAKHLSTWIQELMNDENFAADTIAGSQYKGMPVKAIITVAITKALEGDHRWAEWLAKHGYGYKSNVSIESGKLVGPIIYLPKRDNDSTIKQSMLSTENSQQSDYSQ